MKNAAFLGLVVLALSLEGALLAHLPLPAVLSALFLLFLVLERPLVHGALLAFCVGYLSDLLLGTSRGFFATVYVLAFFLLRLPASRVSGGGPLFVTLGAAFVTFASALLGFTVEQLAGPGHSHLGDVLLALPVQLLLSVVFAYPVFKLCLRLDAQFSSREDDFAFRG